MKKIVQLSIFLATAMTVLAGPADSSVDRILAEYSKILSSLAEDRVDGVDAAAAGIEKLAASIRSSDTQVSALANAIESAARQIQGKELEEARRAFFDLSRPLLVYLNKFHSNKERYDRYYCSMMKKGWIQSEKGVKNPYYGSSMPTCGELIP